MIKSFILGLFSTSASVRDRMSRTRSSAPRNEDTNVSSVGQRTSIYFSGGGDNPRVPLARMVGQEGRQGKFLSSAPDLGCNGIIMKK